MRTNRLFGMNKIKRAMAITLATLLVVGSVNVMEVSAVDSSDMPSVADVNYPQYDTTTGKYVYPASDIFGAATHVHLFGLNVTSTGHTHGNIMAENADISNSGMHEGKIAYPNEYREVTYLGTHVNGVGSSITGNLVLGSGVSYTTHSNAEDPIQKITIDGNGLTEVKIGKVYQDTSTKAVNVQAELDYLAKLSKEYAGQIQDSNSYITAIADKTIHTNQTATPNENVYINIPYAVWDAANNDTLTIDGLDSTIGNRGLVVINIDVGVDANGNPIADPAQIPASIDLSCIGNGIVAKGTNGVYGNAEHSSAAFGSCRIVYNIIDSTKEDKTYAGDVNFNCIAFGSILAPRATVTVGALNGNVMAETINHTGNESHRLDAFPIYADVSTNNDHKEYDEIRLLLTLEGQDTSGNTTGTSGQTEYTLYTYDSNTQKYVPVDSTNPAFNDVVAKWNETAGKYEVIISAEEVTKAVNTHVLEDDGTSYYLVKGDIHPEYSDNDLSYEVVISDNGTVRYAQNSETVNGDTVTLQRDGQLGSSVLTDVLVKAPVVTPDVPSKEFQVNVEFNGPDGTKPADTSVVKYQVYTDSTLTTPVTNSEKTAVKVDDNNWKVVFEAGTIPNVVPDQTYYIAPTGNTSGYKDKTADVFEVKFAADGTVQYVGTADDTTPPTDILIKNEAIELDVQFTGETYTGGGSDVTYKLCDEDGNVLIPSVTLVENGSSQEYKVFVADNYTTSNLERGEIYYLEIEVDSSCTHEDVDIDKYYVQFDENGNAKYSKDKNAAIGTWADGPLVDVLNKEPATSPANEGLEIYVTFNGPNGEPTGTTSGVKYRIYSNPQTTTLAPGVPEVEAIKDGTVWKVVFDESMTDELGRSTTYYITVSDNTSGYKDVNDTPLSFRFGNDGKVQYIGTEGFDNPPTDLLIQNGPIELNVAFTGETYTGNGSNVTYKLCKEDGTPVTTVALSNPTNEGQNYDVIVDAEYATNNLDRNTIYYLEIDNGSDHVDVSTDKYYVRFDANGNAEYSTDKSTWQTDIFTDELYKGAPLPNGKIEINVEFNGPNGEPAGTTSGVKYEIYETCTNGTVSNPVANTEIEATKVGNDWKAVFNETTTAGLEKGKTYYITIPDDGNDSGYKDAVKDVYEVSFKQNGEVEYVGTTSPSTPPTDLLIQNGPIELKVQFTGKTYTGGGSDFSYSLYDSSDDSFVSPLYRVNTDAGYQEYDITYTAESATNNLDRNKIYYMEISNGTTHKDVSEDKYYVKFDANGNALYSTDKSTWQTTPYTDILRLVDNGTIEINAEFNGPNGDPTDAKAATVQYQVYLDAAASSAVANVNATIAKDGSEWKAVFDATDTKDLAQERVYYIAVSNNDSDYKDVEETVYPVIFDTNGVAHYGTSTTASTTPYEDLLIRNGLIELEVQFTGVPFTGTDSKVEYDLYKVVANDVNQKITATPVKAEDNDSDGIYEVIIDADFTTENLDRNEKYYLAISNGSDYKDVSTDRYYVQLNENGNARYSTNENATLAESEVGPLRDILKKVINDKIEVNVEFSGPDGDPEGNNSGVKYEIYEKDANGTLVPVAGSVPQEAVKDPNGNWKVEFDEDATKDLEQEKDYYVTVSNNGSGYKDVEKDPYKVRFDEDGKVEYDGTETPSTPPTDLLIKNDDVKLNVELEGQENGGTNSDVTYDIYDEDGNKVTDAPIQATDKNGDGLYEVEIDSSVTNDFDREEDYYIKITDNGSDYSDKDPDDKFYFTFDTNGKVQYSPDGTNWSDDPLKDVLVKQPADNNNTNDGGAGQSKPEDKPADKPASKPAKKPSSSASNKTDSNNANNSKTDGNNVVITGGNSIDSAKTGEVPTGYIFAGFAGVIALLAGVYFFLKQRNA